MKLVPGRRMRLESESAKAKGGVAAELTLRYFHFADVCEKHKVCAQFSYGELEYSLRQAKCMGSTLLVVSSFRSPSPHLLLFRGGTQCVDDHSWRPVKGPGHRGRRGLLGQTRDEGQATGSAEADRSRNCRGR